MNEQALAALRILAEHLNTTAEHLWSVLIRQAAVHTLGAFLMWFVAIILLYPILYIAHQKSVNCSRIDGEDWRVCLAAVGWVGMGFMLVSFLFGIPSVCTALLNPEYWALEQILYLIPNHK